MFPPDSIMHKRVPPSRHSVFIRGFSGSTDLEKVKKFFLDAADGKCKIDFFSYTEDKRKLFLALRFESHETAKEVINKYDGKEIFGQMVDISWFKDLRKARGQEMDECRFRNNRGNSFFEVDRFRYRGRGNSFRGGFNNNFPPFRGGMNARRPMRGGPYYPRPYQSRNGFAFHNRFDGGDNQGHRRMRRSDNHRRSRSNSRSKSRDRSGSRSDRSHSRSSGDYKRSRSRSSSDSSSSSSASSRSRHGTKKSPLSDIRRFPSTSQSPSRKRRTISKSPSSEVRQRRSSKLDETMSSVDEIIKYNSKADNGVSKRKNGAKKHKKSRRKSGSESESTRYTLGKHYPMTPPECQEMDSDAMMALLGSPVCSSPNQEEESASRTLEEDKTIEKTIPSARGSSNLKLSSVVHIDDANQKSSENKDALSLSNARIAKSRKKEIEKAYRNDCETFATVVKMLISKDNSLEERLLSGLKDILFEIGQKCIEELRSCIEHLQEEQNSSL